MKFSKKIVGFVIISNIIFTAVVFALAYFDKPVSDEIIRSWFRFTGIEMLALAGIKVSEVFRP